MRPQSPLLAGLLGAEGALLGLLAPPIDSVGPVSSWLLLPPLVSLAVALSLASPVRMLLASWCLHVALVTRLAWLLVPWPLLVVPVGALLGLVALVTLLALTLTRGRHHRGPAVSAALLLVTAHPDDECLFFAPAIQRLRRAGTAAHLLCLSTGNYYHQGSLRQKELRESCKILGIPNSRVTLVDRSELPDDPQVTWDENLVADIVLEHIEKHNIGLVLTFDAEGVSGHANHISVHRALRALQSEKRLPSGCRTLYLQTVSLLRKYISIMDLPLSLLLRPRALVCLASLDEYEMGLQAMRRHRSQLVWFRWLYILFSRYMLINTFSEDGS